MKTITLTYNQRMQLLKLNYGEVLLNFLEFFNDGKPKIYDKETIIYKYDENRLKQLRIEAKLKSFFE